MTQELISIVRENLDRFNVQEVINLSIVDDRLIICCVYDRSMKVDKYLEELLDELGIPDSEVDMCASYSGGDTQEVLMVKSPHNGKYLDEDDILKRKPIETILDRLKEYYDQCKVIEVQEYTHLFTNHTNICWEDGIAIFKYFLRDQPQLLKLHKGDRLFIAKLKSDENDDSVTYHFATRTYDWYSTSANGFDETFKVIDKLYNSID